MFKYFNWENAWQALLYTVCAFMVISIGAYGFHKKYTKAYSLGQTEGKIVIVKEVEWDVDDEIDLDRNVTVSDAIRMVDSLNKTIKR